MSRALKGDGTDAYGQMTNASLRRRLSEIHAELREHHNAELRRTQALRAELEEAKAYVVRLEKDRQVYMEIAQGAIDEIGMIEPELARLRATRPLGIVLEAKARRSW